MKKEIMAVDGVESKEQWGKPTLTKLDVATVTKSGAAVEVNEDPLYNHYGPS